MPTDVATERGDGWALVRLSSPAGLNKLGSGTLVPLLEAVRENLSAGCRCLAITGQGGSFAVGADLREIAALSPSAAREFSDLGNTLFRALENSEALVVAAIDGFCLGGGLDLALAADWRLATTRSVFGHPGADLGLITGFGGTQRLPRLIGQRRAAAWILTARRLDAGQARDAGFLQELVHEDDFPAALTERIRSFAARPSRWIREIKGSLRRCGDGWLGTGRTCAGA